HPALDHRPRRPAQPQPGPDLQVRPVRRGVRPGAALGLPHQRGGLPAAALPHRAAAAHAAESRSTVNFDLQELSGTFSVADVVVALALSFVLSTVIGYT